MPKKLVAKPSSSIRTSWTLPELTREVAAAAGKNYYVDTALLEKFFYIFPTFFVHYDGDLAGEPFELLPFWMLFFAKALCIKHKKTHRRRYRELFIYIPRKNVKTMSVATISMAMAMLLKIPYGQFYIMASTEDQAGTMLTMQKNFIKHSPDLQEEFEAFTEYIEHKKTGTFIRALTNMPKGKTGKKPHIIIIDEYQEQQSKKLEMVMKTGAIANAEPLTIKLGTAGPEDDPDTMPWKQDLKRGRDAMANPQKYERFLAIVFESDKDDDPGSPKTWEKVNPGYGLSVNKDSMQDMWDDCKNDPELRRYFCQYNLNMQLLSTSEYIPLDVWDGLRMDFSLDAIAGRPAYFGADLGSTDDLTDLFALVPFWELASVETEEGESVVMHPSFKCWLWTFCCSKAIKESEKRQQNYAPWVEAGHIIPCGKDSINTADLRIKFRRIIKEFDYRNSKSCLFYDKHLAEPMMHELDGTDGITTVPVYQGSKILHPAIQRFKKVCFDGDFSHNGSPILRWNLQNVRLYKPKSGGTLFTKVHDHNKIDGLAAAANAWRGFLDAPVPLPPPTIGSFG